MGGGHTQAQIKVCRACLHYVFLLQLPPAHSPKYILEILRLIQEHSNNDNACIIRWYYFEDDTDMLEAGEDYQATITVPFEIIQRSDSF